MCCSPSKKKLNFSQLNTENNYFVLLIYILLTALLRSFVKLAYHMTLPLPHSTISSPTYVPVVSTQHHFYLYCTRFLLLIIILLFKSNSLLHLFSMINCPYLLIIYKFSDKLPLIPLLISLHYKLTFYNTITRYFAKIVFFFIHCYF